MSEYEANKALAQEVIKPANKVEGLLNENKPLDFNQEDEIKLGDFNDSSTWQLAE